MASPGTRASPEHGLEVGEAHLTERPWVQVAFMRSRWTSEKALPVTHPDDGQKNSSSPSQTAWCPHRLGGQGTEGQAVTQVLLPGKVGPGADTATELTQTLQEEKWEPQSAAGDGSSQTAGAWEPRPHCS